MSALQAAKRQFAIGSQAYEAGDFERALRAFRAGHRLSGRAAFLVNIGHCLRRLGRREQAASAFSQFLDADPPEGLRAEIEAWVRRLRLQESAPLTVNPGGIDGVVEPLRTPSASSQMRDTAVPAVFTPSLRTEPAELTTQASPDRSRAWLWLGVGAAVLAVSAVVLWAMQPSYDREGSLATFRQP